MQLYYKLRYYSMSMDYEKLKYFTSKTLQIIHICPLLSIFWRKIAKFGYRIVYSVPIFALFQRRFSRGFNGDLAAEIERENGSFKRAFPPSTSGCRWRAPAPARMPDTLRPFLYIIDTACARVIIIALVSRKKNAAPKGGVPIAFHSAQKFCSSG